MERGPYLSWGRIRGTSHRRYCKKGPGDGGRLTQRWQRKRKIQEDPEVYCLFPDAWGNGDNVHRKGKAGLWKKYISLLLLLLFFIAVQNSRGLLPGKVSHCLPFSVYVMRF